MQDMNNIYKYLKAFKKIKSRRIQLFGILLMHILKRRYIGIFIDPILGCNFRCRMCYFSDNEKRRSMHGALTIEDIDCIAHAFFHRALKLQIGCGAEPTLSKHLLYLIQKGKEAGIPYISITTNGGLLTYEHLETYIKSGLSEITLSCHGIKKETYEYFMPGGEYNHFTKLLKDLTLLKTNYPTFKIRINYTANEDNVTELALFPTLFKRTPIDVLQIRPIQRIGESEYKKFSTKGILSIYDQILLPLVQFCHTQNIICVIPNKSDLSELHSNPQAGVQYIEELLYCNISPHNRWRSDFEWETDTFESYCKRHRWALEILKHIVHPSRTLAHDEVTKMMSYSIK